MARDQLIGFSLVIVDRQNFGIGCGPVGSRVAQSVVVDLLLELAPGRTDLGDRQHQIGLCDR